MDLEPIFFILHFFPNNYQSQVPKNIFPHLYSYPFSYSNPNRLNLSTK